MGIERDVLETLRGLESFGHERGWRGTDAYDGLNATRIPRVAVGIPLGRRLVIQLVRRSPVDLRPLLGVPPGVNAVSLAWAASAYAAGGFLPDEEGATRLGAAVEQLARLRCAGYAEPCWGYHFDFQSRVLFYPKTAPNTIATAYAGGALLDSYERTGDAELLELAHGTGRFFLRHVPQTSDPPGAFFGYCAGDRSPIHNSNLHVCALLARLHALTGDEGMMRAAREGIRWTVARQRPNGSWPYGERSNLRWIDGFHTGYVLDSLDTCLGCGALEDPAVLDRGLRFYRTRLIEPDGTPKHFEHRTYPLDAWCVAQAIQTFSLASRRRPELGEVAAGVFEFALRQMRTDDGLFAYQRGRGWANRARHIRGVVAPMVLALTRLLHAIREETHAPPARSRTEAISRVQL
jgi:hypothetical protein